MYKAEPDPAPSPIPAGAARHVLLELRGAAADVAAAADLLHSLGASGCTLDESYAPVPMAGGTFIVRCRVPGQKEMDVLSGLPGVAGVWPETPIAPMRPP